MKPITVLGIGNILLSDEGFGVRVVERLQAQYRFPETVQVLDGGTLGMDLLPFLMGTERLLIIDAIDGEKEPGGCYELSGAAVEAYFRDKVSMHELGIQDVLGVLNILEKPIQEVVICGIQPASLELCTEMTPLIQDAVEPMQARVLEILADWQVEVIPGGL